MWVIQNFMTALAQLGEICSTVHSMLLNSLSSILVTKVALSKTGALHTIK